MPGNFQRERRRGEKGESKDRRDSLLFLFPVISAFSELFFSLKMNYGCNQRNSNFQWMSLSHTRTSRPRAVKNPSWYQIHGLSFLTRSTRAHNSILTILLCVFLPFLPFFLPQFLSVSFIPFLLNKYICWKSFVVSIYTFVPSSVCDCKKLI